MSHTRLEWRCRRGMKELDLLLRAYLDRAYASAPADERAAFERLLNLSDLSLWGHLSGGPLPEDDELARLVAKIRTLAPSRT